MITRTGRTAIPTTMTTGIAMARGTIMTIQTTCIPTCIPLMMQQNYRF